MSHKVSTNLLEIIRDTLRARLRAFARALAFDPRHPALTYSSRSEEKK